MKICLTDLPEFSQLSDTHISACWLIDKKKMEQQKGALGK
jgi:oligopeptide transport system ATP-binding protein